MKEIEIMKINLGTVEKVKTFVQAAIKLKEPISLKSGRYIVDSKSIMGVFSLNLSDPVIVLAPFDVDKDIIREHFKEWAV